MLHKILGNELEMLERPSAAFLLPVDCSNVDLFHLSDSFWQTNSELLSQGHGLVLQDHYIEDGQVATNSLIFDATKIENKRFLWQYTHAVNGSRSIYQLAMHEAKRDINTPPRSPKYMINGYLFGTDAQGRINKISTTPDSQLDTMIYYGIWQRGLVGILKSQKFREHAQKVKEKKEAAQNELLRFITERTITKTLPVLEDKDGMTVRTGEREVKGFKVSRDRYEEIYIELKKKAEKVGFVALSPYKNVQL